jgi:23S rRNA (guanine2535-N1)-methyltransferase
MQYKYARDQVDYSNYSSGRVFYSLPGHPAFPIRLASEIFQRWLALREKHYGVSNPCRLYDPCCGAAYHLSVLAYLHGERMREVTGSDIDAQAVALAERNLGLLSAAGLELRLSEISVLTRNHAITTRVFQADATDRGALQQNLQARPVDIVFADIPYGEHSRWRGSHAGQEANPLWWLLEALLERLSSTSIVAIVSDKHQRAAHPGYQKVQQFHAGKRRATILKRV